MKDVFIYKDGGYMPDNEAEERTVKEFMDGPYALRFSSDVLGNVYFTGMDEALQREMIRRGKMFFGIYKLVDEMTDFLLRQGEDVKSSVSQMKLFELFSKVDLAQRKTPEKITIVKQQETVDIIESAVINKQEDLTDKFNSLLS